MGQDRRFATLEQLRPIARAALGGGRDPIGLTRLSGGTRKGAYRLLLDDDSTAIVYVWNDAENFWPGTGQADQGGPVDDLTDPFAPASGPDLYEAAHRHLSRAGIRVPQVYGLEREHDQLNGAVAVLEDVPGDNLEVLLQRDPAAVRATLDELVDALTLMHEHHGPRFGKVSLIDAGGHSREKSCEATVLKRAWRDLDEAADRDRRIGDVRDELAGVVARLAAAVRPRAEYSLIHGELGPDHVLVDAERHPVLIDVEGLMFFDVEWEHVFVGLRFGEHYRHFRRSDLDPQRMEFYELAMRLSLVAGPMRLLDGDFPGRAGMEYIIEHNLEQVLTFLPSGL